MLVTLFQILVRAAASNPDGLPHWSLFSLATVRGLFPVYDWLTTADCLSREQCSVHVGVGGSRVAATVRSGPCHTSDRRDEYQPLSVAPSSGSLASCSSNTRMPDLCMLGETLPKHTPEE